LESFVGYNIASEEPIASLNGGGYGTDSLPGLDLEALLNGIPDREGSDQHGRCERRAGEHTEMASEMKPKRSSGEKAEIHGVGKAEPLENLDPKSGT
jgi:hypothetical protein